MTETKLVDSDRTVTRNKICNPLSVLDLSPEHRLVLDQEVGPDPQHLQVQEEIIWVEDSHGQLLEVKKEEEGDSWWMTMPGCDDPVGTRDQLQHHSHSLVRETQPPPLSSHQDQLGLVALGSDPTKSQLITDCDPAFLSPMEGLVMVEYHDQMVLMMDSDLTDLTMLQDKITLQASDLMSREQGEITWDPVQAPDPPLDPQDP